MLVLLGSVTDSTTITNVLTPTLSETVAGLELLLPIFTFALLLTAVMVTESSAYPRLTEYSFVVFLKSMLPLERVNESR